MLKTPSTVFSACKNGPVLCNGLLYHSKIIIVNAPFYWNQLTIKTLFGRISKFFNKFQGCFTQSGTLEQYSRPSCGTSLQQHLQNFNFQLKYSFRKKDCGYSSWWITIKVKFFRFVSRCSHVWCRSRRFDCILLVFFRRWGRLVMRDLIKHDALLWLVVFQQLWLVHFDPCCSLSDLLPRRSAVARLSCCCVFWSWAPTLLEFLFHYPCWCC